ncbi:MAG: hypothetical protein KJO56_01685 [Gammaproteobacteria bacterium]|nr:hypothetical protein [Gammaproteobacteria bacterium]MBT8104535.1 hypothetical protein [Gammaproteobacteria bacterium]NNK24549.1 hypothetical protein [Woeseiaceae bacterium]
MNGTTQTAEVCGGFRLPLLLALAIGVLGMPAIASAEFEGPYRWGLLPSEQDYNLKLLGKFVFFDEISLDENGDLTTMACVTCHTPDTGGTFDDSDVNLNEVGILGANPHTRGTLKPPSNTYASMVPSLFDGCPDGPTDVCGGNFYDGRAEGVGGGFIQCVESHTEIDPVTGETIVVCDVEEFLPGPGATVQIGTDVIPAGLSHYDVYLGPIADQALNPFPNDVEQNVAVRPRRDNGVAGAHFVCRHVAQSEYRVLYRLAWGEGLNCRDEADVAFKRIAIALSAYQASGDINSFTSKRDYALLNEKWCVERSPLRNKKVCKNRDFRNSPGTFPLVGLSQLENLGHDIFYNTCLIFGGGPPRPCSEQEPGNVDWNRDLPLAQCSFCHETTRDADGTVFDDRYTDDAYHAIGPPHNREVPGTSPESPNLFLGGHTGNPLQDGLVRTPTLRNVDKRPHDGFVKAYATNGWFKSLDSIVHFYNTARSKERCEDREMGRLGESGFEAFNDGLPPIGTNGDPQMYYTEAEALAGDCWPDAEIPGPFTRFPGAFGLNGLGLTPYQEKAIVAYMKTFSDRFTAQPPKRSDIRDAVERSRREAPPAPPSLPGFPGSP